MIHWQPVLFGCFWGILAGVSSAMAAELKLKYLAHANLETSKKFEKTRIGGLSGIVRDSEGDYYAVSDDRGNINEPRIYKFKIELVGQKLEVKPLDVLFLKFDQSHLSHQPNLVSSKRFAEVLDLEGITLLPWGDFLLSSEGELNHRPRINPQIFSVNQKGVIQKSYELPAEVMAELTGQQKKGLQNNLALEGLSASPDQKKILIAAEAPLLQDSLNHDTGKKKLRWIEYEFPDAWVLKAKIQYLYPLEAEPGELQRGLSEIHWLDDRQVLALERAVKISAKGIEFVDQVFVVDLSEKTSDGSLKKKKLFDFSDLQDRLGPIDNFEAIAWGPEIKPENQPEMKSNTNSDVKSNGKERKKTLIFLSDDNFKKSQKTQFVLFEIQGF